MGAGFTDLYSDGLDFWGNLDQEVDQAIPNIVEMYALEMKNASYLAQQVAVLRVALM